MESTNAFTIINENLMIDHFKDNAQLHFVKLIGYLGYITVAHASPNNSTFETAEAGLKLKKIDEKPIVKIVKNKTVPATHVIYKEDEPVTGTEKILKTKYDEKKRKSESKPKSVPRKNKAGEDIVTKPKKEVIDESFITEDGVDYVVITYTTKRSKFIPSIIKDIKNYWTLLLHHYVEDLMRCTTSNTDSKATFDQIVEKSGTLSKFINSVANITLFGYDDFQVFGEYSLKLEEDFGSATSEFKSKIESKFHKIKNVQSDFTFIAIDRFTRFFKVIMTNVLIDRCGNGCSINSDVFFTNMYKKYVEYGNGIFNFMDLKSALLENSKYVCAATKKVTTKKTKGDAPGEAPKSIEVTESEQVEDF